VATHKHIAELIVKHRRNTLSDHERQELEAWCGLCEENQLLFERLNRQAHHTDNLVELYSEVIDEERGKVRPLFPRQKRRRYITAITYMAMIVCLLFTGIALYSGWQKDAGKKSVVVNRPEGTNALAPDVHRVQLKLANGRIVYLDSSVNGHIALQYRSVIYKRGDLVRYEWSNGDAQPELEYNTITTPRTRKFVLELPDGSIAWLNASSSITFPTAFINKERIVLITGEVYFEVNPNPVSLGAGQQKKPFIVYVNQQAGGKCAGAMVEVMGTHFNINGYGDEPVIKTTVLQGKVRVSNQLRPVTDIVQAVKSSHKKVAAQPDEQSAVLIPGQQARVNGDGQLELIKYADIQEVMAWHKDLLIFNDLHIKQIMQQISRQYDYEVEYKEPVTGHYTLSMTRQSTVEQVLEALELSGGISFDIDGPKIIVSQ
jgi:ferric-dicitrate binding protein FerR (iron transport regulator)